MNINKKYCISFILLLLIFCLLFFVSKYFYYFSAIYRSLGYINNHTEPSGKFVYQTNMDKDFAFNPRLYSILRHAGTLYSMYQCEELLHINKARNARLRASDFFIANYIKPYNNMYVVLSKFDDEGLSDDYVAKLGAQGLALVSLSNLYPENKIDLEVLRGIAKFIIFMQNYDGSFKFLYNINTNEFDDEFYSLFYSGEAALGLLYLYDVDKNTLWLTSAKNALLYLAKSRENLGYDVPFDHWSVIATKKLFETQNNGLSKEERNKLQYHCKQIALSILEYQIVDKKSPYYGCFSLKKSALGTVASIMEGLSAIYYCIDDKNLKKDIKRSLKLGNNALVKYQIKSGELSGGIPISVDGKYGKNPNDKFIRIDLVQHTISAWISYIKIGVFDIL